MTGELHLEIQVAGNTLDVSRLAPEAHPIARAVAEVFLAHTRPWFIGLVCFGSAARGGVIPGASDLDFHLYLDDAAFSEEGNLPLDLCMAIQRDLALLSQSR